MVFSTHHASSEEPRLVPYRATADVPHELVEHVCRLIYARRCQRRSRWRKPGCPQQALHALVHPRKNEPLPAPAAGSTVRTPYYHHREQPAHYQQFNRDHARLRAPGERAFAQLKSWRLLRRARCSTRRIGTIIQAIHALPTCWPAGQQLFRMKTAH
ncbi:transposase family protein [Streptomyces sp. NPDC056194]|uniref:transposase family protein n=1 Tax=unclassified Streptomyces TaxID=2593676 RepID=UPI0035DF9ADC